MALVEYDGSLDGRQFASVTKSGLFQFSKAASALFGGAQVATPLVDKAAGVVGFRLDGGGGAAHGVAIGRHRSGLVSISAKGLAQAAGWSYCGARFPVAYVAGADTNYEVIGVDLSAARVGGGGEKVDVAPREYALDIMVALARFGARICDEANWPGGADGNGDCPGYVDMPAREVESMMRSAGLIAEDGGSVWPAADVEEAIDGLSNV